MTGFIILALVIGFFILTVAKSVIIVRTQEFAIVERLGKFHNTLQPGISFIIPYIDNVRSVLDMRERQIDTSKQNCITQDNAQITLDGVLYLQLTDPKKATYGAVDPIGNAVELAQTTLRSAIGKMSLDDVTNKRTEVNKEVLSALDEASHVWGVKVLRFEIKELALPPSLAKAMELQMTAERQSRETVLKAEGEARSRRLEAEANKAAQIAHAEASAQTIKLQAEAEAEARIRQAQSEAEAILIAAKADGQAILVREQADLQKLKNRQEIMRTPEGEAALKLDLEHHRVHQIGNLAKESTVTLMPSDLSALHSAALTFGVGNQMSSKVLEAQ